MSYCYVVAKSNFYRDGDNYANCDIATSNAHTDSFSYVASHTGP